MRSRSGAEKQQNRERAAQWRLDNLEQWNQNRNKARKKLHRLDKAKAFAAYGNRCACCGENEPRFLTIDHINNDGAEHRRTTIRRQYDIYGWLRRNGYPPSFQILCWNCNCGRAQNDGVCPHEERHE